MSMMNGSNDGQNTANKTAIAKQFETLEAMLPLLKEKETQGLILPSYDKARSLLQWFKSGRTVTEKQQLFVGRLILRANRKHKNATVTVKAEKVDEDALVQRILDKVGSAKTDVELVSKTVLAALDARLPRKVEITLQKVDGKMGKVEGPKHKMFEHLARAASARLPTGYPLSMFLQGEASSGKTTGSKQLADALGLKWYFNGAISFPHEMLGFIDANGKYHTTPFREAYEKGGVYTFDEVDRSDPVALLAVNPHLANGIATFPDKQVKRHKDCIIICTANTWGLGADANYSGATKLDAAFLSRFPVRLNWDIDPELEAAIVPHPEWLAMVRHARSRARAVGLKVLIDTRAAQAGLALIQAGYNMQDAANMTYLANLKPEQRTQLQATA
jgi:hypothetical protein